MTTFRMLVVVLFLTVAGLCAAQTKEAPQDLRMPPRGIAVLPKIKTELENGTAILGKEIAELQRSLKSKRELLSCVPDVQIYYNAVHYALEDDIFYRTNDFGIAKKLLGQGMERARLLREGKIPWATATGLVVRGYVSKIDGSVQPYGLVVPPSYQAGSKHKHRLDFWFHGRGDKLSELAFINDRQSKPGEFTPTDAFVLHPYGRYCNAYKFAGEVDAFEALENVRKHYPIDENRIVDRGFSMGGAATWHMVAHHAGLWAAASPGAGFVETAIYQKIFEKGLQPTWFEQKLWHLYDATDYAGNLFNCPVIAYSGEIDPQKQAADLMAKAMTAEGLDLVHIIGPNTGHKYEAKAKLEVARRVDMLVTQGRNPMPKQVKFTTWTLRYNQLDWVTVDGLDQHWNRARVNAEILDDSRIKVDTTNVSALTLSMPGDSCPLERGGKPVVMFDGQEMKGPSVTHDGSWTAHFQKQESRWKLVKTIDDRKLAKRHGLQGPIDDAFMDAFIMVRPTGEPLNAKVGAWATNERAHAVEQWRLQFRGEARTKEDRAITEEDIASSNLILWGDPRSNRLLAKIINRLPIHWDANGVQLAGKSYSASEYAPVLIYPNPLNPKRYVVLNTGFTFSEVAHLSNSLQVPKLPDYAVVNINIPIASRVPRGVAEAGFFGERWELLAPHK
ncbi:MAG: alpha/beta hydrolase: peptidase or carbohydrate esterase [Pedosphaera sp.]|nr:alpha/beta hydrolase: peptidase or carbohydrate esterase [Pedosphaera sp.]